MFREADWFVRSINDQLWASWVEYTDSRQETTLDNLLVIVSFDGTTGPCRVLETWPCVLVYRVSTPYSLNSPNCLQHANTIEVRTTPDIEPI